MPEKFFYPQDFHFRDHADMVAACEYLADECVDYSTDFVNLKIAVHKPFTSEVRTWLDEIRV